MLIGQYSMYPLKLVTRSKIHKERVKPNLTMTFIGHFQRRFVDCVLNASVNPSTLAEIPRTEFSP